MKTKRKLSAAEKSFYALDYVLLLLCSIVVLFPLINVVSQSLSSPESVLAGRVFLLPKNPTLNTYKLILRNPSILTGYLNSLLYMGVGTTINIALTLMCAYPLARKELAGRNLIMFLFTFTMMFSGGMIPTYINIKNLGLIDSRLVMILPSAMTVWNMILARTFLMNTIPQELYESAGLDGASDIRVLLSIVIPLSTPIIAVLVLYYAVGHWNAYFDAMMYLNSQDKFNIQLVLRNAISNITAMLNQTNDLSQQEQSLAVAEASKYAIIVISILPVMIIYPFVQKHFVKGVMIGSIKG
ncbi:MAG: carbohydrate ABC transporter permease [Oscillospiraceae bacterium]